VQTDASVFLLETGAGLLVLTAALLLLAGWWWGWAVPGALVVAEVCGLTALFFALLGAQVSPRVLGAFSVCLLLSPLSHLNGWFLNQLRRPVAVAVALAGTGLALVLVPVIRDELTLFNHANELLVARQEISTPELEESLETVGITTTGLTIPLFHPLLDTEMAGDEVAWLAQGDWEYRVIRLGDATLEANCHGHVFAHGKFWVLGRHVSVILQENSYEESANPLPGDLAIYRDSSGMVSHSGVVRGLMPGGAPLVESKWGLLGIFLHTAIDCPYDKSDLRYYRHPTRTSHHLDTEELR